MEVPVRVLECKALEVGYGKDALLPPIQVTMDAGSFCVVVGRNGSGKSTWLKTVLGLIPPVRGQVICAPNVRLAYLPQRLNFDAIYPLSARDVVSMGALRGRNFLHARASAKLRQSMEEVDVWPLRDLPFRSLSEGQKQRVLLARALVGEPDVAFMDEPTAAMDVVAEREMLQLVDRLRRQHKMAVVMIHHELDVATEFAEHVLLVDRTAPLVLCGTPQDVIMHPAFARAYGAEKAHELLLQLERAERTHATEAGHG